MKLVVLFVLIGVVGLAVAAEDYCSKSLCKNSEHIACKNSGGFAKICPKNAKLINISKDLIKKIVQKHNELRNTLATGQLKGFKSATNMASMVWNDELAKLAELNVKTCVYEHDKCHNTIKFKHSGQNLAQVLTTGDINAEESVIDSINEWWGEHKDTTSEHIKSYPMKSPEEQIGHFTVMARNSNNAMGCAGAIFDSIEEIDWTESILACNYATTNIVGAKTYIDGKTASECKTGVNPIFEGLCSEKEFYVLS